MSERITFTFDCLGESSIFIMILRYTYELRYLRTVVAISRIIISPLRSGVDTASDPTKPVLIVTLSASCSSERLGSAALST